MRRLSVAGLLLVLMIAATTAAGPVWSFGGGWWGSGFGGDHGGKGNFCVGPTFAVGPFHGFWPGGWFDPCHLGCYGSGEYFQERFETRLDDFKSDYDAAVAEDPDFYTSDLYEDMVDRLDRMTSCYDRFVTREEAAVERLGESIDRINERIDDLNQWLADDPDDDSHHPWCEIFKDFVDDFVTAKIEWLADRVDCLTEKKNDLAANLETYLAFQTDLLAYLDEVTAAGNPPEEAESLLIAAVAPLSLNKEAAVINAATMLPEVAPSIEVESPPAEVTAVDGCTVWFSSPLEGVGCMQSVPEPLSIVLLAPALMLLSARRSRPR